MDIVPEEARDVKTEARSFAEEHILPVAEEYHRSGQFPKDVLEAAYDAGLAAQDISEQHGGRGFSLHERLAMIEELFRADAGIGLTIQISSFTTSIIESYGDDRQCERFVEPVAKGDSIPGLGSTEPHSGSDLAGVQTTAEREGDEYVLNGEKWWITNGVQADWITVYALTGDERGHDSFSLIILPTDTDGVDIEPMPEKSGMRASEQGIMTLENARVPVENRIGEEGKGFSMLVEFFNEERVIAGGHGIGLGAAALEEAWKFTHDREGFGQTVSEFQTVQHELADMAMNFEQARSLVWRSADMVAADQDPPRWASMAKVTGTEMAADVAARAATLHGGRGVLRDRRINRVFRDSRAPVAYEGANPVQRGLIYRHLD